MSTAAQSGSQSLLRVCLTGLLALAVPGLGHFYVGQRVRGGIILLTIGLTFWAGVAIGGPRDTINPHRRFAWFMAQACTGGHAAVAYGWGRLLRPAPGAPPANPSFQSLDAAVVYTGIAGLLNLLAILDALARADAPAARATRSAAAVRTARERK